LLFVFLKYAFFKHDSLQSSCLAFSDVNNRAGTWQWIIL
jgi:hypothetical protein